MRIIVKAFLIPNFLQITKAGNQLTDLLSRFIKNLVTQMWSSIFPFITSPHSI